MLDQIPNEIILYILNSIESTGEDDIMFLSTRIHFIFRLRMINRNMYRIINELKGAWKYIPYIREHSIKNTRYIEICNGRSYEINSVCKLKSTPIYVFKWLMDNNIYLSLDNISSLIINNRKDVIELGFQYKEFMFIMFNRFYMNLKSSYVLDSDRNSTIFNMINCLNPIIIAAENNRIEIVKLLLEKDIRGNPFIKDIPDIFDKSIKYNHKHLLNYIIVDQYVYVKDIIKEKVSKIIQRITNCEDILYYLILNEKIDINHILLEGCIIKKYNEVFTYCYENGDDRDIHGIKLIRCCFEYNNSELLNYLINEKQVKISSALFSRLIYKRKNIESQFILNIIKNHLPLINRESELINLCISKNIENKIIFQLIDGKFKYTTDDIYLPLQDKNIELLKYMVQFL